MDRCYGHSWSVNFQRCARLVTLSFLGGSNNNVDPRFLSHFCVFYIPSPANESLFRIFSTVLQNHTTVFPSEIQDLISSIINATLRIYDHLLHTLVPTPLKSHYVFSLRDLSRIIQGLLQTTPERFSSRERFVRVWLHECTRVFADRLNDRKDRELFARLLEEDALVQDQKAYLFRQPLLYADYRTALHEDEPKIYEDLQDYPTARSIFDGIVLEFKEQHGKTDIVLFNDALEHITRIYRVLRLDRGHLLLIGTGGSGKKLLTKVAAFAARCQMFEIQLTRNYNELAFREDLKALFNQVGLKNVPTVLIMGDAQIVEEGFLEYINNILSSGMVPALFTEEVGQVLNDALFEFDDNRNEIGSSVTCATRQRRSHARPRMRTSGNTSCRSVCPTCTWCCA